MNTETTVLPVKQNTIAKTESMNNLTTDIINLLIVFLKLYEEGCVVLHHERTRNSETNRVSTVTVKYIFNGDEELFHSQKAYQTIAIDGETIVRFDNQYNVPVLDLLQNCPKKEKQQIFIQHILYTIINKSLADEYKIKNTSTYTSRTNNGLTRYKANKMLLYDPFAQKCVQYDGDGKTNDFVAMVLEKQFDKVWNWIDTSANKMIVLGNPSPKVQRVLGLNESGIRIVSIQEIDTMLGEVHNEIEQQFVSQQPSSQMQQSQQLPQMQPVQQVQEQQFQQFVHQPIQQVPQQPFQQFSQQQPLLQMQPVQQVPQQPFQQFGQQPQSYQMQQSQQLPQIEQYQHVQEQLYQQLVHQPIQSNVDQEQIFNQISQSIPNQNVKLNLRFDPSLIPTEFFSRFGYIPFSCDNNNFNHNN